MVAGAAATDAMPAAMAAVKREESFISKEVQKVGRLGGDTEVPHYILCSF